MIMSLYDLLSGNNVSPDQLSEDAVINMMSRFRKTLAYRDEVAKGKEEKRKKDIERDRKKKFERLRKVIRYLEYVKEREGYVSLSSGLESLSNPEDVELYLNNVLGEFESLAGNRQYIVSDDILGDSRGQSWGDISFLHEKIMDNPFSAEKTSLHEASHRKRWESGTLHTTATGDSWSSRREEQAATVDAMKEIMDEGNLHGLYDRNALYYIARNWWPLGNGEMPMMDNPNPPVTSVVFTDAYNRFRNALKRVPDAEAVNSLIPFKSQYYHLPKEWAKKYPRDDIETFWDMVYPQLDPGFDTPVDWLYNPPPMIGGPVN